MKKFVSILLASVFIMIFYFSTTGLFRSEPPLPTITTDGKSIVTVQGSYCWKGLFDGKCVDMVSPPEMIKHVKVDPVVVSPEAQLKIKFKNKPHKDSLQASRWISDQEREAVQLNNSILTVPKEKGIYIYDVFARWDRGSSSYVFVVEVQ